MVLATSLSAQVLNGVVSAAVADSKATATATVANSKIDTNKSTDNSQNVSKTNGNLRSVDGVVWGTTKLSGSAIDQGGLKLADGTTSGVLNVQLDVQKLADIAIGDKSQYEVKLPDEFAELSKTDAFREAITGQFRAWNLGIPISNYTYTSNDLTVKDNTIIFNNPSLTDIIGLLPHLTMNLSIDLGKAVTDSGVRIPDAFNGFYTVESALVGNGNIVDWGIGSSDSKKNIELPKLDPGYNHAAPVFNTDRKVVEVPLNSKFDDSKALEDIQATDELDGNLTSKIKVDNNFVDTSKEGYYNVNYSVVNSIGLKTTKTIKYHVVSAATLSKLAPEAYRLHADNVLGTYSGNIASLKLYNNGYLIQDTGDVKNGSFKFYVGDKGILKNDKLTFNAYDKDGALVLRDIPVAIQNDTKGTIVPSEYKIGERNITGTYTDDVAQARLYINGVEVSKGGTFTNGKFTYYVGEKTLHASDKVTMNAYDKDGNLLQKDVSVVINQTPDSKGTVTPSEYTVGNVNITGTYTGDVAKARVTINGIAQSWGGTFTNGQFSYYVGAGKIKAGDNVSITVYDKNNKVLDNKNVTVKDQNTKGTITPNKYTIGDTEVTGTYTGDVAKARVSINGKEQAWGGTFSNGKFSYYVGAGKIKAGDTVTITAYDKNDKVLDQNETVLINSDKESGTITPNEYTIGDTEVTGTYTGDVTKARVSINGKEQAWGGTFSNGKFSYYVGAGKIKAGDTVTITAYDKNDKVLDQNKVITVNK